MKNLVNNFVSSYIKEPYITYEHVIANMLKIVILLYLSFINNNRKIETILSRESYLYFFISYHFEVALLHDLGDVFVFISLVNFVFREKNGVETKIETWNK